uniref:Initiator protein NS1 n=1 Tax=Newlavirus TaxID=2880839 RepID=A0A9E8LSP2_9VIRU|nr:NS1 [Newlavirus]
MAQASLEMELAETVSFYRDQEDKLTLSFVFKTHEGSIKEHGHEEKELGWSVWTKQPVGNDTHRQVRKNIQDELDLADKENGEEVDIPSILQENVSNQLACVQQALFDLFQAKGWTPDTVKWFIQVEWGRDTHLHTHVLIHHPELKPVMGKWLLKFLRERWARNMVACYKDPLDMTEKITLRRAIENNEWVQILTYKHKSTRKEYTKCVNFTELVANYFLQKPPVKQTVTDQNTDMKPGYIMSLDSAFKINGKSYNTRKLIAKKLREINQPRDIEVDTTRPQDAKRRRVETQKEITIKETCVKLYNLRVVTVEDWMLEDPDSYIHHVSQAGGEQIVKNILSIAALRLSRFMTAFDLILEKPHQKVRDIKDLKVYQIFASNGYNPYKVLHAMMCCLNKESGKRNTIYFNGPASTGKSLLAQTLCNLVGNVGCYNPANVNFPFNDCTSKNIIWVEECGNFGQQVNQFKAVCSGQSIRIDQKGKGSQSIEPTPVVLTTNEAIEQVRVGCELRPEHTQPIKDRMVNIRLHYRLPGDFGLIDKHEYATAFNWMVCKGYKPTMASYTHHWGNVPDWAENWAEPSIKEFEVPGSSSEPSDEDLAASDLLEKLLGEWEPDEQETSG